MSAVVDLAEWAESKNLLDWVELNRDVILDIRQIDDADQYATARLAVEEFSRFADELCLRPELYEKVVAANNLTLAHLRALLAAYESADPNQVLCDSLEKDRKTEC